MASADQGFLRAVGDVLRARRQAAGLSQEALAEASGLHRVYISELERGRKAASLTALQGISRALGVPLSEIIADAERTQPS